MLKKLEPRSWENVGVLLEVFKLTYMLGDLNFQQLMEIIQHPEEYQEHLQNQLFHHQSAELLLRSAQELNNGGNLILQKVRTRLDKPTGRLSTPSREALKA